MNLNSVGAPTFYAVAPVTLKCEFTLTFPRTDVRSHFAAAPQVRLTPGVHPSDLCTSARRSSASHFVLAEHGLEFSVTNRALLYDSSRYPAGRKVAFRRTVRLFRKALGNIERSTTFNALFFYTRLSASEMRQSSSFIPSDPRARTSARRAAKPTFAMLPRNERPAMLTRVGFRFHKNSIPLNPDYVNIAGNRLLKEILS
jgi:hypothetical protein